MSCVMTTDDVYQAFYDDKVEKGFYIRIVLLAIHWLVVRLWRRLNCLNAIMSLLHNNPLSKRWLSACSN